MPGPIDIDFRGDPTACHRTADWLSAVAEAVERAGTEAHRSCSESEAAWLGQAAGAFRSNAGDLADVADELEQRANEVSRALHTFAAGIDDLQRQARDLRARVIEEGLTVAGTAIMPPGPGPSSAPVQPPAGSSPGATEQYERLQQAFATAYEAHERKVQAFAEAETTVAQLRERENETHRALNDVLTEKGFLRREGLTRANQLLTTLGATHTAATETASALDDKLALYDKQFNNAQKIIDTSAPTDPASIAARRTVDSFRSQRDAAETALTRAQRAGNFTRWIGGRLVNANFGQHFKNSDAAYSKAAVTAGKKLPYVGVGLTAMSAAQGIAEGKPPAKEVEKAVGSTAASIAAGAAVGTMVGGPVGTVLGVGVGFVASYGVGELVDWKNGPIEQANRALGLE